MERKSFHFEAIPCLIQSTSTHSLICLSIIAYTVYAQVHIYVLGGVFVFLWDKVSGMPMTLFRWAESSGDSLTGQSRVPGGDY